jgi:hypothetical protein
MHHLAFKDQPEFWQFGFEIEPVPSFRLNISSEAWEKLSDLIEKHPAILESGGQTFIKPAGMPWTYDDPVELLAEPDRRNPWYQIAIDFTLAKQESAVSSLLSRLFHLLNMQKDENESGHQFRQSPRQKIAVQELGRGDGGSPGSAYIGAYFSPTAKKWLEGLHAGFQEATGQRGSFMLTRVHQAITAVRHIYLPELECNQASIGAGGRLNFVLSGMFCDCIHTDIEHHDLPGMAITSHNVDSLSQQLPLLAGVAALCQMMNEDPDI